MAERFLLSELDTLATATASAATIAGAEVLLNKKVALAPGETNAAAIKLTSGALLASPEAGAVEYDGVTFFMTNETTAGRGMLLVSQCFKLTAAGSNITTIANFFGANSNIPLVANAYYEIEIILFFTKNTAGAVTWTLTNSAAPTLQQIMFEMSPVTGMVAPPGTATMLHGQYANDTTAVRTILTGSISNNASVHTRIRVLLRNGSGTSLKIQATAGAGSITPGAGSRWICRRISPTNTGTFAA